MPSTREWVSRPQSSLPSQAPPYDRRGKRRPNSWKHWTTPYALLSRSNSSKTVRTAPCTSWCNLVVVKNQTNRQRKVQLTLMRFVELAAVEARADDVQLCLGERALHSEHKAVVELGRVVTAVLVDYQRAGDSAQLEQAMPVLVRARQARSFEGE